MGKVCNKQLKDLISVLDEIIDYYKEDKQPKKRDWRTYEQRFAERMKTVFRELKPLIQEVIETTSFSKGETRGVKSVLPLEKRL